MHNRGFTFLEILIVIAIIGILSTVVFQAMARWSDDAIIDGQARTVYSVLSDARSRTIASKDDQQYGVYFATTSVVLFKGAAYSATSTSNATTTLSNRITLSTSLTGSSTSVVFSKITGKANVSGTTTVSITSTPSRTIPIVIYPTGVIEMVE